MYATSATTLRRPHPRGLNQAAIRLGALLMAWGRRREARSAERRTPALLAPELLAERRAAAHEARAALAEAHARTRLHIR
jgi:hypothetical protein